MALVSHLLAFPAAALTVLLFFKVRSAAGTVLWFPKALAGSAVAWLGAAGVLGAVLGFLSRTPVPVVVRLLGAVMSARHGWRIARAHDAFERAFGADGSSRIEPERQSRMLRRRWVGLIPSRSGVRWTRDPPFWTIPGWGSFIFTGAPGTGWTRISELAPASATWLPKAML